MNKQKDKGIKIVGIIVIVFLLVFSIYLYNENKDTKEIQKENLLFKTILYANSQSSEVSVISQKADSYYSEASFFYENSDFKNTESNCRLAREYYSDSSQGYRDINSKLQKSGVEDPLIDIHSESLEFLAEIELNMFEACEHFESASRYYDKYYNTNVPHDDSSYDMGGGEIGMMNEKIRLHDENVRKYNDLLSKFKIELEDRLKE